MDHFAAQPSPFGEPLVFDPLGPPATFGSIGTPGRSATPGESLGANGAKRISVVGQPPAGFGQSYTGPSQAEFAQMAYADQQRREHLRKSALPPPRNKARQSGRPTTARPVNRPAVAAKSKQPAKSESTYFWSALLALLGAAIWCVPCWYVLATMNANGDAMSVKGVAQALVGLWFITTWFVAIGGIGFFIGGIASLGRSSSY